MLTVIVQVLETLDLTHTPLAQTQQGHIHTLVVHLIIMFITLEQLLAVPLELPLVNYKQLQKVLLTVKLQTPRSIQTFQLVVIHIQ
jgi:hypothetical protein